MLFLDAVEKIHNDLTSCSIEEHYTIPEGLHHRLVYLNSIIVYNDVHNLRIDPGKLFDLLSGCIIHNKNAIFWKTSKDKIKIPDLDAGSDVWFNFSMKSDLTKELYIKYLEIIQYADERFKVFGD